MAYRARLNEDSCQQFHYTTPEEIKLRRRLWWTCFLRECLSPINYPRSIDIQSKAVNVPSLSVEDFSMANPLSELSVDECYPLIPARLGAEMFVRKVASFISSESIEMK